MVSLARVARTKEQSFQAPPASADGAWNGSLRLDALEIAKKTVLGHVLMGHKPTFGVGKGGLGILSGAVVDLRVGGVLRGRSGGVRASAPLTSAIVDAAYDAVRSASPPITRGELASLEIELTVPGPILAVKDPAELRPKRLGVIAQRGSQLGFVLPQHVTALEWSNARALRQACTSARLPPECQRDPEVRWQSFEARVLRLEPSPPAESPSLGPGLANKNRDR
jgi:AMMECR1 domain-containing protein